MQSFFSFAVGVISRIVFTSMAEAITVDIAEVQNGAAFLRGGKAAANATITWEGTTVAMSNSSGSFNFVGVVPDNCVGTLSDGMTTTQVFVLDCRPALSKTKISNKIVNGSFKSGDLTGWSTLGDVSVQTSSLGDPPPKGKFQVLITNALLQVTGQDQ